MNDHDLVFEPMVLGIHHFVKLHMYTYYIYTYICINILYMDELYSDFTLTSLE